MASDASTKVVVQNLYTYEIVRITTDDSGSFTQTLEPQQRVAYVDAALGAGTIVLPPVDEAEGLDYTIIKVDAEVNAITVDDNADDSKDFAGVALSDIDAQWDRAV